LSRVKDLVSRERAVTLEILIHLIEVERRRLHVGFGYASMFDYCTRHLRYSSSAASRRIQSARCIRDYPEVYELLEENEVNLVTISLIASILNDGKREGPSGQDPWEIAEGSGSDRGNLPPSGIDAGPCDAGSCGRSGAKRSPTEFDKR